MSWLSALHLSASAIQGGVLVQFCNSSGADANPADRFVLTNELLNNSEEIFLDVVVA